MSTINNIYECPECHTSFDGLIPSDENRSLGSIVCSGCGRKYHVYLGCVDFVTAEEQNNKERLFYQERYSDGKIAETFSDPVQSFKDKWESCLFQERREVLERIGDPSGKTILCLGNGDKDKELYFSNMGANLIISDISMTSILGTQKKYGHIYSNVDFHAVNAYKIPLKTDSIDIIYGWQMTHHLSELADFLKEVKRVLKKSGMAIFVDNANSPAWHFVKWNIFGPFVRSVHKKKGVSPRDLEVSHKGDYKEEFLSGLAEEMGFKNFRAKRINLILYIFSKAVRDVLGIVEITEKNKICYPVAKFLLRCDNFLYKHFKLCRDNQRNMVWSFEK